MYVRARSGEKAWPVCVCVYLCKIRRKGLAMTVQVQLASDLQRPCASALLGGMHHRACSALTNSQTRQHIPIFFPPRWEADAGRVILTQEFEASLLVRPCAEVTFSKHWGYHCSVREIYKVEN